MWLAGSQFDIRDHKIFMLHVIISGLLIPRLSVPTRRSEILISAHISVKKTLYALVCTKGAWHLLLIGVKKPLVVVRYEPGHTLEGKHEDKLVS